MAIAVSDSIPFAAAVVLDGVTGLDVGQLVAGGSLQLA
jgi:hypothetical protein